MIVLSKKRTTESAPHTPKVNEQRYSFGQVLNEDFQACRNLVISGGWGYSAEDAIIMEPTMDMVATEYLIVEKRLYEELIIYRPVDKKYSGIKWDLETQNLISLNGKTFDFLRFNVTAFLDADWEFLAQDWEEHNGYFDDPEGLARHEKEREKRQARFVAEYWFDISKKWNS